MNYSFTDAEYNEELVEPLTGTRGVVDGNNATTPASIFTVAERNLLIDGQPLPRVPKHKGTGWAEYVQSLGDRGRLTYLTSLAWTDEFPAAGRPTTANPLAIAPSFLRWDARVSWTSASEQWTVSGYVNNITDDLGVRNQFTYGESQGYRRVIEPTNPRWWGLEVQYKFWGVPVEAGELWSRNRKGAFGRPFFLMTTRNQDGTRTHRAVDIGARVC